tara:strand:+ start:2104 stop:2985 length:882 start_codon:yes stop_codon:yes gene_type:complete
MAFKMKGWKAFTTEDNSNNRPDGRAGSSAFQKNGLQKRTGGEPMERQSKRKKPSSNLGDRSPKRAEYRAPDGKLHQGTKSDYDNRMRRGAKAASPMEKNGDVRRINKAKKITRKHVEHNTVDSPSSSETTPNQQRRAERKLTRADKKLQKADYSTEQREEATGATGYKDAMDWATEPMVTKRDKAKSKRAHKKEYRNLKKESIKKWRDDKPKWAFNKDYFKEDSPMKKTIAKNAGIEPLKPTDKEKKMKKPNPNIHTGPRDFEPAWEGADISEKRWNSMTKKEQKAYTERYGD